MTRRQEIVSELLTPAEVAALFKVDPKTVTRWAVGGRLAYVTTLGGHRRYKESDIRALIEANTTNVRA
jgi:excisionase family DNA binding protein